MEAIRIYLANERMTQVELARRAGMSPAQLNHYIHNRRLPGARTLVKLSRATGLSLDRLVKGIK
jgi:transcriptional regulator with XRE-family HTH domain